MQTIPIAMADKMESKKSVPIVILKLSICQHISCFKSISFPWWGCKTEITNSYLDLKLIFGEKSSKCSKRAEKQCVIQENNSNGVHKKRKRVNFKSRKAEKCAYFMKYVHIDEWRSRDDLVSYIFATPKLWKDAYKELSRKATPSF